MPIQHAIRVLLLEGDRPVKILLERDLPPSGSAVIAIQSGEEADELAGRQFDTSQLDFEMPGVGRIETRHSQRGSDLVVMEDIHEAVELDGVFTELDDLEAEYLTRPLTASDLGVIAREAAARRGHQQRAASTLRTLSGKPFVAKSPKMLELLGIVERVAAGSASILIQGETGTGKTLIARLLHALSPRSGQRLVAINCSAFQEHLLESEIFGHEKGAFTGAVAAKTGLFEVAHRGSLFLDEVGDMSSPMQAKLLQVLDDGELRRVGATKTRRVDVRIIAASNKDLQQEVRAGRFREDLFFRLKVIHLTVPRLADRREDISELVGHFLDRFRQKGQIRKGISPEALQILTAYSWPGNVRELANTIEGLLLLAPGDEIRAQDLPHNLRPAVPLHLADEKTPLPLSEIERLHIIEALRFTEGKKAPAARLLGIDVKTLSNKIKGYDIHLESV